MQIYGLGTTARKVKGTEYVNKNRKQRRTILMLLPRRLRPLFIKYSLKEMNMDIAYILRSYVDTQTQRELQDPQARECFVPHATATEGPDNGLAEG
jgi:hypothetical protein